MPFDKANATGHNCKLHLTPGGHVLVQSRNTGPLMQRGIYTGRGPFQVTRNPRGRDVIECKAAEAAEAIIDARAVPFTYFYFALRASWTYDDSDAPEAGFTSDTNYPMFESGITGSVNGWQGFVGKKGTVINPPPLSANPFKRDPSLWVFDETSNIQEFSDVSSYISTYTLNTLWFYRGELIPGGGNEIRDGAGLGTATPAHAGAVLTGGLWEVLWDVYTFDGASTYTFVETKTYGPFTVPPTADPADHTTWASVSPGDDWAIELGVDNGIVFRNLRVERVT